MNKKAMYGILAVLVIILGVWFFTRGEEFVITENYAQCVEQGGKLLETCGIL